MRLILLIVLNILLLSNCDIYDEKNLIGSWENEFFLEKGIITFNENLTGSTTIPLGSNTFIQDILVFDYVYNQVSHPDIVKFYYTGIFAGLPVENIEISDFIPHFRVEELKRNSFYVDGHKFTRK